MTFKLTTSEWLLITLLVASPLYFHANIGGTGFRIPNNIVVWLSAAAFVCWSLFKLANSKSFYVPRNYLALLAFPIIAWLSSFFAGVEIGNQWLLRLLFIWGGVLFLFSLFQLNMKQGQWDRLLFFILFAGLFHGLAGLSQIILVTDLPSWLPTNPAGNPTGFFQQINNQASFQVSVIAIAMWLNTRPLLLKGAPILFYFSLVVIFLSGFIVAYSGSRIGALGFIIAAPLMLISRWQSIKRHGKRWLLIIAVLITSIGSATLYEQDKGLMSVAEKTAALNAGYSASARLGIYTIAWELIKEKPLFGHGMGSFVRVWQYEKPEFYEKHPNAKLPNQRVSHPHNELMFWLVEAGILSGIGLFILFISTVIAILRLPHCRRYAYLALLVPISLHTQVELPFYISSLHWFLFLILLALTLSHKLKAIPLKMSVAARKSIKIVAIIVMIFSSIFLMHSFKSSLELKKYTQEKYGTTESMKAALVNPYFKTIATNLVMLSMYKTSVIYDIEKNINLFSDWAEQTIPYDPDPIFFELVVKANLHIKNNEKACKFNHIAISMYPDNLQFQRIKNSCMNLQP
jgi:O-antigen polymerase